MQSSCFHGGLVFRRYKGAFRFTVLQCFSYVCEGKKGTYRSFIATYYLRGRKQLDNLKYR